MLFKVWFILHKEQKETNKPTKKIIIKNLFGQDLFNCVVLFYAMFIVSFHFI